MTLDDFRQSLTANRPPAGLTFALAGLWWDSKGNWTRAHESAQQDEGTDGSWVHAYLHQKEGDLGNAAIVWSGGEACVPTTTGCGMAQHCERTAGVERGRPLSGDGA